MADTLPKSNIVYQAPAPAQNSPFSFQGIYDFNTHSTAAVGSYSYYNHQLTPYIKGLNLSLDAFGGSTIGAHASLAGGGGASLTYSVWQTIKVQAGFGLLMTGNTRSDAVFYGGFTVPVG